MSTPPVNAPPGPDPVAWSRGLQATSGTHGRPNQPRRTVHVISPHLDDAVLGAGAFLAAHPGSTVTTVLAGNPPRRFHVQLTDWDRAGGMVPGQNPVAVRRGEDRRALDLLAATPAWLPFVDGQYRQPPDAHDVASAIAQAVHDADLVLSPVGFWHPDHVRVADACIMALRTAPRAKDREWWVYAGSPYRMAEGGRCLNKRLDSLRARGIALEPLPVRQDHPDAPRWLHAKRAASAAYQSQVRALRTDPVLDLRDTERPEQYWRVRDTNATDPLLAVRKSTKLRPSATEPRWARWRLVTLDMRMEPCRRSPLQRATARSAPGDTALLGDLAVGQTSPLQRQQVHVLLLRQHDRRASRTTCRCLAARHPGGLPRSVADPGQKEPTTNAKTHDRRTRESMSAETPIEVIVGSIDEHRAELGVEPICRALQVAASSYYAAKRRQVEPSARALPDAVMAQFLCGLWIANRKVYGTHKLWKAARRAGLEIGRDQVTRLMCELSPLLGATFDVRSALSRGWSPRIGGMQVLDSGYERAMSRRHI
jgi:LmbE family N-acetylglucosaminyl deacetylase